jgi:putative membrane protein
MNTRFGVALMAASVIGLPALAQSPPATNVPAPPPTVTAPAILPGAPVAPLTDADAQFVRTQLEGNVAEIQVAQLVLQRSQDQSVRDFAQKMITDHGYAESTLLPIAQRENVQASPLTEQHRALIDRLGSLTGPAFDHAYVDAMVREHAMMIQELNAQLTHGLSQQISAWVQNTRPTVLQHSQIAQQLLVSLPPTG